MKISATTAPDTQAARHVRDRLPTHQGVRKTLLPELRARAFAIANLTDMRRVAKIQETVATVSEGKPWTQAKREIKEELAQSLSEEKAAKNAERIVKEEIFRAISAARYKEMTTESELEQFPYWEYHAVGDQRTRSTHQALDGITLPANDPFWKDHYPPWDYGCRCTVLQISELAAQRKREAKDPKFIEDPERLKKLRKGILEIDGKTTHVFSPRQQAITPAEHADAYRNDPGDLTIRLSQVRDDYLSDTTTDFGKIKVKLFSIFQEKAAAQTVVRDGRPLSVWDWCCESDLRDDAAEARRIMAREARETSFVRLYDSNALYASAKGDIDAVPTDHPDNARYTIFHQHPAAADYMSPADLIGLCNVNCVYSALGVGNTIQRYRLALGARQDVLHRALESERGARPWTKEDFQALIDEGKLIEEEVPNA